MASSAPKIKKPGQKKITSYFSKWPLRRQLLLRFFLLATIIQIIIITIVIINIIIISDKTLESSLSFLEALDSTTSSETSNIQINQNVYDKQIIDVSTQVRDIADYYTSKEEENQDQQNQFSNQTSTKRNLGSQKDFQNEEQQIRSIFDKMYLLYDALYVDKYFMILQINDTQNQKVFEQKSIGFQDQNIGYYKEIIEQLQKQKQNIIKINQLKNGKITEEIRVIGQNYFSGQEVNLALSEIQIEVNEKYSLIIQIFENENFIWQQQQEIYENGENIQNYRNLFQKFDEFVQISQDQDQDQDQDGEWNQDEIEEEMRDRIRKQKIVVIMISILSSVCTISIVSIFTYMVAVRLSRPLGELINLSSSINNNSIHNKNQMREIMNKLRKMEKESQHQVKTLITTFKNLIKHIQNRNPLQNQRQKKRHIDYPLNQYDPEFVQKAKGDQEINWRGLIAQVKDEAEEQQQQQQEENQ